MKKSLFLKLLLLISFSGVIIPTGLAASSPGTLKWKFTPEGGEPALSAAGDIEFQVPLEGPNEYSCPGIAADGTIYFGSHDNHVYAMNPDGTVKWRYRTGHRVFKTAVIDADGTIYIGSDDCFLYALDPDGQLKWRYRAGSWFNSPLLGEYGSLYAGSGDGYLYALERNGSLRWKFYAGNYVRHGAVGSDGTIYFGTFLLENRNDQFFALNPDGTVKWRYPLQGGGSSAPAIGLDGTIYFTSQAGSLIALNSDGAEKWSFPAGSKVAAAPVIAGDGTIYFGSYDAVFYAVNPDGTLKWRYFLEPFTNLSASSKNLPQGFDDFPSFPEMFVAAAVGADGTIYFGATDDNLYALSPLGELKWKFSTGGNVNCPPAIDRNGIIYFGSMDRNFYALDSGTEAGLAESPWPKFSRDMVNSGRSDYVEVPFGRLTVDSVLTAFDSSFTVGIGYQVVQATAALELSLEFDNQSIRADSVSLTDRTKAMTILALDIDSANVSGSLDLTLIDLSLTNPISGSTGKLVNVHFTEIKNIVQVLELRLSNYAGSTPDGTHIDLTATAGTVIIKKFFKSCDINEDGLINIADLISLLLKLRSEPDNPDWDWNEDGVNSIADVVALLLDMRRGECPDFMVHLSSTAGISGSGKIESLSRADIEYLEEAMAKLPLTADEQAAFRLAIYGKTSAPSLPAAFHLEKNAPNPFNPSTMIGYHIPEGYSQKVSIVVYDLRGRQVRTLVDSERQAGTYSILWDGTDNAGRSLASGVYLYRMQAGNFTRTRKMVLLK